jgi:anti-sigma regulatory factor (Ser/Thr protein kinase)
MRATRTFEPQADQIGAARRFASATLAGWGIVDVDVALLVSELATNAVLHARSEFAVTVSATAERVRVEVFDRNSRLPSLVAVPADAYSGRGLMLVEAMATAWGVDASIEDGKAIWFELRRPNGTGGASGSSGRRMPRRGAGLLQL